MPLTQLFVALLALAPPADAPPAPTSPEARIKRYSEAIEKNPKDEASYRNRAIAYAEKRDYARAIADLARAKELADGVSGPSPAGRRAQLREQIASAKIRISFQQALVKNVDQKQKEALKNKLPPAVVARWGAALADAEKKLRGMEDELAKLQKELDRLQAEK